MAKTPWRKKRKPTQTGQEKSWKKTRGITKGHLNIIKYEHTKPRTLPHNEHGAAVTVCFREIHRPVTSMTKTTLQTRFGLEQPLKHGDTEENDEEYAKTQTNSFNNCHAQDI